MIPSPIDEESAGTARINRFPEFRFWSHGSKVGAMAPDFGAMAPKLGAMAPDLGAMAPKLGAMAPDFGAMARNLGPNGSHYLESLQNYVLQIEMCQSVNKIAKFE